MKRVISFLMAVVMVFGIFSAVDLSANASNSSFNRPALSEASAIDFLQFIYNEKLDEGKIRNSKYFPLLTGKFSGSDDEYKAESIAFSIFVRTRINELVSNSEYNLTSSYNYLYSYLSEKLESSTDLPQEVIDELKGTAMKKVEEGILDLLINCVADTTDIIVTEEHISWVNAINDGVSKVNNLADQVAKYIEYTAAAIQGCRFILAKEQQQRYWYFSSYLKNREGYASSTDEIFKAHDDINYDICCYNTTGAFLTDSTSWITGKSSWVNHREAIQEWAEFVYQIENSVANQATFINPVEYNGHTYQVFDDSMNWTVAKEYCESLGGHLVTITSGEEQSFLIDLVKNSNKKNVWIGAYPNSGIMQWITGENFDIYNNWADGEPNNVFNMQNAVMMYTHKAAYPAGTWNDENENGRNWSGYYLSDFGFICEWDNTYSNIISNNHNSETHTHVFRTEIVEPTCTSSGYTKYICETCNYFKTDDYVSSLGHNYQYSRIVNPTCTEKGYDLYTCTRCSNGEKIKYVDAIGHNYTFTKTVAPTCTAQGCDLYTCTQCNGTEKRNTVSAIGHKYIFTKTVTPTCTAQGYDLYTCTQCNGTEKRNTVNATGHSYSLSDHREPTCNEAGFNKYTCSVCNNSYQNEIAALDGSALTASLDKAQKYLAKDYFTEESLSNLQSVYDNHKNDLATLTTQEAVDNAVTELNTAISELVLGDSASGETAEGFSWNWERSTGTLTVRGSGAMPNYNVKTIPWCDVIPYTTQIIVSDGITSIGNYAFYKAENVTNITLPNGLEKIGMRAFEYCSFVEELIVPDSVKQIGYGTFASMTSLKKVTVPASTTYCSYCFNKDTAIEEVIVTYGVDGIIPDSNVTREQPALLTSKTGNFGPWRYGENTTVKILDGVTTIGAKTFYNCTGISSIELPDSVETIRTEAFVGDSGYTEVEILNTECVIEEGAISENKTIVGYSQSTAEKFANDYSIPFRSLSPDLSNFIIKTVSISLESGIRMNFKVLKSAVADFKNPYVVFSCEDDNLTVTEYTEQGDYYVFSYPGISPQLMNDNVVAVLHAEHNGIDYTSPEKVMSVRTYAYTMLERYNTDDYAELRTLLVDLLNYGAVSQEYIGYQTDNLVNADLTEEQKTWGTVSEPTFENIRDYNYKTIDNPTSKWVGSGLVLNNSVTVRAKFSADSIENKTVVITCGTGTFTYSKNDFIQDKDGNYYVYCDELFANEMSEEILLTVYDNGVACSNTMRFSIESYASLVHDNYEKTPLDELTTAMMRYGNSAKAYGA